MPIFDPNDCPILDGGMYNAQPGDILNGGMYNAAPADVVDGSTYLGVCPPFNMSELIGGYLGSLGDGGSGHSAFFHDRNGTVVIELPCQDVASIAWSRELTEVSRCVMRGGSFAGDQVIGTLRPWVHHVTVYRDGEFVWTGVVQVIEDDGDEWTVTARDYGALMWRTRTPLTKSWVDTDPVTIAVEHFAAMYGWHRVPASIPTAYASAVAYDYSTVKDRRRIDQVMTDLVKLGIDWTIYRGRAVIMPTVRSEALVSPVGYADCDFGERMAVKRDGTRFFNDIMVKGQNFAATATREIAELRMQDIVAIDDLFGANNIRLAAEQLVARRSAIRLQVSVPSGATLLPDSPITINGLMPGVIFPVFTALAGGVYAERRLEKVEVVQDSGGETVQVTLGQVPLPASAAVDFEDL